MRLLSLLLLLLQFWCPMHPDERSGARGTCAICGMALVRMPPAAFATYPVDLRVTPTLTGARLRLAVMHPSTRAPRPGSGQAVVRKFSMVHERPMHLFVVGDSLDCFAHEHPALRVPPAGRGTRSGFSSSGAEESRQPRWSSKYLDEVLTVLTVPKVLRVRRWTRSAGIAA